MKKIKSFPHYHQHDAMDCGPTCLRMIAAYYGKKYTLENLRNKSFLTREGVSLLGISEAAEEIGFRTIGARIPFDKLSEAPLPFIVHWNQEHFVVVYNIKKKRDKTFIDVADPGGSKVSYSQDEFCRSWLSTRQNNENKGFVLLLEPTPEFYQYQEEENINRKGFDFFLITYVPIKL